MKTILFVAGLAAVLILLNAGCAAVRGGYATAPYRVVRTDGKFQVRDYPDLVLVQTSMQGSDNGFMRLFHYIAGQNGAKEKIAMTTPVYMAKGRMNGTMAFVLPATVPLAQAPAPAEPGVTVAARPAGRFAVYRFSGGISTGHETNALARLQTWVAQQSLAAEGEPIYGYFDPPWTPAFLRRNEVMLRLSP